MAGEGYKRHQERKQDHDIHTEVNERSITYINIQKGNTDEMESEFVEVPTCFKGYVIGKRGCVINEIRQNSGARVDTVNEEEKGFTVSGDQEQRACAKKLISEKLEEIKKIHGESLVLELVPIPTKYKGLVIGKQGNNLKRISHMTGARVIRKDGEVCIVSGTEEERQKAKVHIKITIAGARMRGLENEFNKSYHYIDSSYLPADCKLKLKKVVQRDNTDDTLLPESRAAYYRLSPVQDYEPQDGFNQNYDPMYLPQLVKDTLEALNMVKGEIDSKEFLRADMWCHFGTGMIRGPSQVEARDGEWSIDEVTEKLRSSSDGVYWNVAFKEVANLEEKILEENVCDKTPEEYVDYAARHDLSFLTPSGHQIRFKVWVTRKNVGKRLEDIPLPLSDVKNILHEIQFKDEGTRSRCRGWLVLPSRRYLQADILFPGCEFDCRLTVRGQSDSGLHTDYVPNEEETRALSTYLSEQRFTDIDEKDIILSKENLPREFHLIYNRFCRRAQYEISPGFTVILSKERSWRSDAITEETRESKDFYLHCREWDQLLNSREWKPEKIVEKLPAFFRFVKKVQSLVLERTVPPEILARGIAAVEAYNRALSDGKTLVKRVPIMLIGQDRAGKTSLKKSLKGICFDPQEDSTVGIDIDPSYFKVSTETWKTGVTDQDQNTDTAITFDYQTARHIMWALKEKEQSPSKEEDSGSFDSDISKDLDSRSNNASNDAEQDETIGDPCPTTGRISPHSAETVQEDVNVSHPEVPDEVAAVTETLLQDDLEENGEEIYSNLWDFAGQSVYYTTHPLFFTKRAIYCLVYDLSLNPDDKAKPVVKQGVYEEIQESFHLKTNFDYLQFWMTSVASLGDCKEVEPSSDVLPEKLPPVFLVCTHADTPYGGDNPRILARKIFGRLKRKPYGAYLSDVFFVDNTSLSLKNSDCPEVTRLRQEVLATARELPYIKEAVPIKWLKFEKALQAVKENKCIFLESAKDIALNVCNIIDQNEFETLMNYLHDLRSLIHYDDSVQLNKLVILDPQWLVDVFKKVITVRPYDPKEKNYIELWSKLETKGILDERLLTHVWGPLFKEKETTDSLLGLMERFSLLCPWLSHTSGNKEYLVPSMLMSYPPEEVYDVIDSARIPSLFLKFPDSQVPPGFFPRLVAQLFQWGKGRFWAEDQPQPYHDFVRFYASGGAYSAILVCHSLSVEVVIHGGNPGLERRAVLLETEDGEVIFARQVCRQLHLMLECMRSEFPWMRNMRYEMSVLCPVCSEGRVVAFCQTHQAKRCKQEQCLHFWSVPQLCSDRMNISCTRSPVAQTTKVQVTQFLPWFHSSRQQTATDERGRNPFSCNEVLENDEKALAVRSSVFGNLSSKSCDAELVVRRLQKTLQLDQSSLKHPDSDTKKWIRCVVREARHSDRLDVVEYFREITPAGTTGPLLPESLDVRRIPFSQARQLTIAITVAGGDKWMFVAEKLGLNQEEIRFLNERTTNPVKALLDFIADRRYLSVGELYQVLCDCGIPVIADRL